MGFNRRPVQRMHKLRDNIRDDVKGAEKIEKRDKIMNTAPQAYNTFRGIRRRLEGIFGKDSMNRKIEHAWEQSVDIERIDFGGADFGLRVTFPSSAQGDAQGLQAGDELRIMQKDSVLAAKRYEVIDEVNSGDVAAGKARFVSDTELRLPDDAAWSDELGVVIRVELGAGVRS